MTEEQKKSKYFQEKSKFYYDMFLKHKLVKKVSVIVKVKDKYLMLFDGTKAFLAGGSVDINETTKDAAKRELFEEMQICADELQYVTKMYYSVDWKYGDIEFKNKRVEFYYLCKINKQKGSACGLDGEFNKNVTLKLFDIFELEQYLKSKKELEIIKNLEKSK